jgi:hypothetical protein
MYAMGQLTIERPNVVVVPSSAIVAAGNEAFLFTVRDGRAVKLRVQRGIDDGTWWEVNRIERPPADGRANWASLSASDFIIVGDALELTDGMRVEVSRLNK